MRRILQIRHMNHIMLTTRIDRIASYIGVSDEILLQKHSLYPYFIKFLPVERRNHLKEALLHGVHFNVLLLVGLHSTYWKPRLSLCPECVESDILEFGEPYFHRTHQLPGSLVCHKHNVFLVYECDTCKEEIRPEKANDSKITPTYCSCGHLYLATKNSCFNLLSIAKENYYLLNTDHAFSVADIKTKLLEHAKLKGYCPPHVQSFHFDKLIEDILGEMEPETIRLLNSTTNMGRGNWIKAVFWTDRSAKFPLHYILVMLYFSKTIKEFFAVEALINPFGSGPWPCLNVTCPHNNEFVIKDFIYDRPKNRGKPLGVFKCSVCDFTYTLEGPLMDSSTLPIKPRSIRKTGFLWDSKFEKLLDQDIINFKAIAKELNVGPAIIKLRITENWGGLDIFKSKKVNYKQLHREGLLSFLQENPGAKRGTIKVLMPGLSRWLTMNDRVWFDEILSKTRIPTLDERRSKLMKIISGNPSMRRMEIRELNASNYEWLLTNDFEWANEVLPGFPRITQSRGFVEQGRSGLFHSVLERRREKFLRVKDENPQLNLTQLAKVDNNYFWLKKHDPDWLRENISMKMK